MSIRLLREMTEALVEFHQAYEYVCELHEADLEAPSAPPRPSKIDPNKASAAANLVSKNHAERNKHTVVAHSMAATAHRTAAQDASAAGKEHLAAVHQKAYDYHMGHPHGPKPIAPKKGLMNLKRPVQPSAKLPAKPAVSAEEAVELGDAGAAPLAKPKMKRPVSGGTMVSAKPVVKPDAPKPVVGSSAKPKPRVKPVAGKSPFSA